MYLAWGALGLLQGPLGPLTFEHGAEITFPTSAENAASFLSLAINLSGFVVIIALTPLLELPVSEACASVVTPAAGLVLACALIGVVLVFLVKEDNRRVAAEKKWEADEPARRAREPRRVESLRSFLSSCFQRLARSSQQLPCDYVVCLPPLYLSSCLQRLARSSRKLPCDCAVCLPPLPTTAGRCGGQWTCHGWSGGRSAGRWTRPEAACECP